MSELISFVLIIIHSFAVIGLTILMLYFLCLGVKLKEQIRKIKKEKDNERIH